MMHEQEQPKHINSSKLFYEFTPSPFYLLTI
jgi:hypothetical protein